MITYASVTATSGIVDKLIKNGFYVEPFMGNANPLSELMNASCLSVVKPNAAIAEDYETSLANVVDASAVASGADGVCAHDMQLDNLKHLLANAIRAEINTAKNVVNPIVMAASEDVNIALRDITVKAASTLSIIPDIYDAIWSSAFLVDMVRPFAEIPAMSISPANVPQHPTVNVEILMNYIKTGASRFDSEIMDWVAKITPEFVLDVYNNVFLAYKHRTNGYSTNLDTYMAQDPIGRNRTLVVHLLSYRLPKELMEGIEMDADEYALQMATIFAQSGRVINRIIERRTRDINYKNLVMKWPVKDAELMPSAPELGYIVVNMDIYANWLEQGGTPEVLYGAAVSDHCEDPNKLIEDRVRYEERWSRRNTLVQAHNEANRFNATVAAMRTAISKIITELDSQQIGQVSAADLNARLIERLKSVNSECLVDLYGCVRSVVCDVLFPNTNAKTVLERMDAITRANPNYTGRESGLIAYSELICNWIAQFMVIRQ